MPGIEKVQFGLREISEECPRAVLGEKWVIPAPRDQHGRLRLPEVLVPLFVEGNICWIVVQEVELYRVVAGTVEEKLIDSVSVGADGFRIPRSVGVLEFRRSG